MIKVDQKFHRAWVILLAMALILAGASEPILNHIYQHLERRLHKLQETYQENATTLHRLKQSLANERSGEDLTEFLTPQNRLQNMVMVQQIADRHNLIDFTYSLSPEISYQDGDLAMSRLTLSASARDDLAIYAFLRSITNTLPGRLELRDMQIERRPIIATKDSENIHFKMDFEWLTNPSPENDAP